MKTTITLLSLATLTACGGGGGGGDSSSDSSGLSDSGYATEQAVLQPVSTNTVAKPANRQEAARFLTQATFGPTDESINRLMSIGYSAWLQEQFASKSARTYVSYWDKRTAALKIERRNAGAIATSTEINHAFWAKAVADKDQLRQRVAFALSEIFVISMQEGCAASNTRGTSSYMDMLGQKAFGTYRDLLESVTLHPIMGCYLSHLRNQKENPATGRVPDENFAREIMQLFSIGLVQLNPDGTPKLDTSGRPLETYGPTDVSGLAKVFTGWSFSCPDWPQDGCFLWGMKGTNPNYNPLKWISPMRPYAKYHSTSEKRFLGTVIPPQSTPDPAGSLKVALDTIANHPNVGPFIGKQLIQRLVTSNPSPAYVKRVASVFNASKGSLQATVVAILMDPEARDMTKVNDPSFGKVREPLLRLSAVLRAYQATSQTGDYLLWSTHDPATGLGQAPLQSPSVFNFFRPGYTAPNSFTSGEGLVAPELQIVHESSAAGYVNTLVGALTYGLGAKGYTNTSSTPDVRFNYQINPSNPLFNMSPEALVEDANQRLMYGTLPEYLRTEIVNAVKSVYVGSKTKQTAEDAAETRRRRVMTAVLLVAASPEFQVQK